MNRVDPQALVDLSPRWPSEVAAALDRAITAVARTELVHSANFTVVAPALASVHVVAENYFQRQLEANVENAEEFASRLVATATAWDEAEEQNRLNHEGVG
jgi:alpha-D-ribose 1-methylphosphonate 5-triphosphate synthase subunit PhnL